MALSILIFHYTKWTTGTWNPINPFGVLGVYGVSIFFVLSGMVLTLSTEKKIDSYKQPITFWKNFFKRRVLRIFPLLVLATLLTLILDEWKWSKIDIYLNFSGLFGFIRPASDIATGAWSIGCELVYYALFPLIWWLLHPKVAQNKKIKKWFAKTFSLDLDEGDLAGKMMFFVLLLLALIPFCYYAFYGLQPEIEIQNQWAIYVQPFNHVLFFLAGIGIAKWKESLLSFKINSESYQGKYNKVRLQVFALFLCIAFFMLTDTPSDLVTDWTRVGLSAASIYLCWVVLRMDIGTRRGNPLRLPMHWMPAHSLPTQYGRPQGSPLHWLGDVSYSLYLLHPIVYRVVLAFSKKMDETPPLLLVAIIAFLVTLVASHFVYFYFEKKVLEYGRKAV